MTNLISTLVGEERITQGSYWDSVSAPNGCIYGIPSGARRVIKFNPVDKSITYIGPDFGDEWKWMRGAMADSGIIYCPPFNSHGILKIDTNTDTVTKLDVNLLPERGTYSMWDSCAAALDGCIYFVPSKANRIMKLDPHNNDAMTSVGDDVARGCNFIGTVVGIDGCVYGMPEYSRRIIKYDPVNDTTSFVGEEPDKNFECYGNGTLGRDGCIYALAKGDRILKIDTANNSHCFVGNSIQSDHSGNGWCEAILGIDGCIYWAPFHAKRTLKYDPHTNQTSLVGCDFGSERSHKWSNGALAADGVIYCIPMSFNQVLAIDPLGEFLETISANMEEHPETFGFLFQTIEVNPKKKLSKTHFDHAVVKFGQKKVFEVLDQAMKPVNVYCQETNLFPFMIVASYKESTLSAINHLLCRDLSWVNNCTRSLEGKGKTTLVNKKLHHKKRKHNRLV